MDKNCKLRLWWCGDDSCDCHTFEIWRGNERLWMGGVYSPNQYSDEVERAREEVLEACARYGIKVDCSSESLWEWS